MSSPSAESGAGPASEADASPDRGPASGPVLGLLGGFLTASGVGALVVVAAALWVGWTAASAALLGLGIVVAFFAFGAVTLAVLTQVAPAQALLFALLTYSLQVTVLAGLFAVLRGDDVLSRTQLDWLGVAIIAGALGWTLGQLFAVSRAPLSVMSAPGLVKSAESESSGPNTPPHPGGARSDEG